MYPKAQSDWLHTYESPTRDASSHILVDSVNFHSIAFLLQLLERPVFRYLTANRESEPHQWRTLAAICKTISHGIVIHRVTQMEIYPPIAYTVGSTHVGTNVRTTVNTLYGVHVTMNASRMALAILYADRPIVVDRPIQCD